MNDGLRSLGIYLVVQTRPIVPPDLHHQTLILWADHPTAWDASVGIGPLVNLPIAVRAQQC
jgi:hypothetical protein